MNLMRIWNNTSIRRRMMLIFLSVILMIILLSLWYVFWLEYSVRGLNAVIDGQNVRAAYGSAIQSLRQNLTYGENVQNELTGRVEALRGDAAAMYAAYPYRAVYDLCAITDTLASQVREHLEKPEGHDEERWAAEIYDSISQVELVYAGLSEVVEHADRNNRERIKDYRVSALQAFAAIVAGCTLLCLSIVKRFSESIVRPIEQMAAAAKKVSQSDYNAAALPDSQRNDEIGYLFAAFNGMVRRIQVQIEAVRRNAELEQQLHEERISAIQRMQLLNEAELNMLQSQVNPHFLFNCMSLIRQTAYLERAKETGEITEALSDMLRYGLYRLSQVVTVRDEISDVKNFCFLMEKRFGDRIRYNVAVEETCMDEKIPCRALQPLVENSYRHGMDNVMENGYISVSVSSVDGRVLVRVEDNGCGIQPDQLRQIEESIADGGIRFDRQRGIGLANVLKRMLLFYRGDFQYSITSIANESTSVAFSFPSTFE